MSTETPHQAAENPGLNPGCHRGDDNRLIHRVSSRARESAPESVAADDVENLGCRMGLKIIETISEVAVVQLRPVSYRCKREADTETPVREPAIAGSLTRESAACVHASIRSPGVQTLWVKLRPVSYSCRRETATATTARGRLPRARRDDRGSSQCDADGGGVSRGISMSQN